MQFAVPVKWLFQHTGYLKEFVNSLVSVLYAHVQVHQIRSKKKKYLLWTSQYSTHEATQ